MYYLNEFCHCLTDLKLRVAKIPHCMNPRASEAISVLWFPSPMSTKPLIFALSKDPSEWKTQAVESFPKIRTDNIKSTYLCNFCNWMWEGKMSSLSEIFVCFWTMKMDANSLKSCVYSWPCLGTKFILRSEML